MTRLILSLDSEDFETPAADDAELWWAQMLARHGVRGVFCLVGELARALRRRGRRDVLQAYAGHEVGYHSNFHSVHPTHSEYLEELDWADGVARVLREESSGVWDVREVTGQQPTAYCKPGNSWGPQVAAAMPQLGMPVFCDAPLEWAPGRPMWYSGSLCVRYHLSLDQFFDAPEGRLDRMRHAVEQLLEKHSDGFVVIYTHPCRLFTAAFPDNFNAGKNPDRSDWRPSPLRTSSQRLALQNDLESLISWIAGDLRPNLVGFRELWDSLSPGPVPWFNREQLRKLARLVPAIPSPVEWEQEWLSPAEQWSVLVGAVGFGNVHLTWPKLVSVTRLLGPVRAPAELPHSLRVPMGKLMHAARLAVDESVRSGHLPSHIPLSGEMVGPNTLLQACARAIPQHFRARWPEQVTVSPAVENPAVTQRADFAGLRFQNTWRVFPPSFQGKMLLEQARLQSWTAKPAHPPAR